jgi:hypothetical protein
MKRIYGILTVAVIVAFVLFSSSTYAQLPEKSFSISASFGSSWDDVGLSYTFAENFEAGLGVVFKNVSYSVSEGDAPDSETRTGGYAWGTYYLTKGKLADPYIGVEVYYIADPTEENSAGELSFTDMGVGISFGAQAFITDGVALWGDMGVTYSSYKTTMTPNSGSESSHTTSIIEFMTASVGASFYF